MSSVPSHDEAIFSISSGGSSTRSRPTRPRSSSASLSSRLRRRYTSPSSHLGSRPTRDSLRPPPSEEQSHSQPPSRRGSQWAVSELSRLIREEDFDLETYGLTEFRDGFFDAAFMNPKIVDYDELMKRAEKTLPRSLQKRHPLSLSGFLPKQWRGIKDVAVRVFTTRGGIKLLKTFLGVFGAYVLCLVPAVRDWLGPYSYILVISTIINHPGRSIGAQLDGCVSTILGTFTGLGWGAFGLWLSHITMQAEVGYGAILATFLGVYIGAVAITRAYFIRLYQFVICAGIAVCYTVLAEASEDMVRWSKLLNYGIPWLLGQALCVVICVVVFPDAGARSLAVSIDTAFAVMLNSLDEQKVELTLTKRRLAQTFVNLSQAYRDLAIDFTITLFDPKDMLALRNSLQAVVRGLLAIRPKPDIFHLLEIAGENVPDRQAQAQTSPVPELGVELNFIPVNHVSMADELKISPLDGSTTTEQAVHLVCYNLEEPTSRLISRMRYALKTCHAVLMDMSGYRKYLGPGQEVSSDLLSALVKLRKAMLRFDAAEDALLEGEKMAAMFVLEGVEVFAYCRPIRQAAKAIEAVLVKVMEMEQRKPAWPKVYAPSYPWKKCLNRTNPQVRHDRGGVTAGSYYKSFDDIARLIQKIKSSSHQPGRDVVPEGPELFNSRSMADESQFEGVQKATDTKGTLLKKSTIRFNLWRVLHRMQGFETRFALKNIIVCVLLAMPAWLTESRDWWNSHAAWWAVAMAWMMMHPRVGGNLQDLVTRAFMAVLGAVWSGAGHAAGNGSPYVMGVFAAIYLLPMLYRFTQSNHPRSGLVGCLSFTVTSLTLMSSNPSQTPGVAAAGRGVAFVVGVVAAVVINWILWPFVARHELRKAVSAMLFFLSIVYRSIVAKYIYYEQGHKPTAEDIQRSEILEGRLREGFVRIRQLMGLTRHEIRLRAPFDPLPYSALAESCERLFELLIAVRESALFFDPKFVRDNDEAMSALLSYRRDAVASILTNLYILAGALRANRKVPKYLPSAAVARKRLMDRMVELEEEFETDKAEGRERKKWVQIYSYSYNESLTGCVAQLEELERYTKVIVGEQGFQDGESDEED